MYVDRGSVKRVVLDRAGDQLFPVNAQKSLSPVIARDSILARNDREVSNYKKEREPQRIIANELITDLI